jgi:hypothetical protein
MVLTLTPDQIRLLIRLGIAAIALVAAAAGGWTVNGWRLGEKIQRLEDQSEVLVVAVNACSASVEAGEKAGAAAIAQGEQLLAEARRLHAGGTQAVRRIEDLIKKKPPAGPDGKPAGCDEAWAAIESKAGAPR